MFIYNHRYTYDPLKQSYTSKMYYTLLKKYKNKIPHLPFVRCCENMEIFANCNLKKNLIYFNSFIAFNWAIMNDKGEYIYKSYLQHHRTLKRLTKVDSYYTKYSGESIGEKVLFIHKRMIIKLGPINIWKPRVVGTFQY